MGSQTCAKWSHRLVTDTGVKRCEINLFHTASTTAAAAAAAAVSAELIDAHCLVLLVVTTFTADSLNLKYACKALGSEPKARTQTVTLIS